MGCWITTKQTTLRGTIIRNICYYIPLFFGIIINFYLIKKVKFFVNSALPDDPSTVFLNRLQWYPYLLLLILITYLLKVIALFFTRNEIFLFVLLIFTTCCVNLLGVYNFIIFGYTKAVKEAVIAKFKELMGGTRRESEEIEENENISNSNSVSEKIFAYDVEKPSY